MQGPKPDLDLGPEADYLNEAAERLRELLGGGLVGVYAGGSYALGDYRRQTSDLDVAAVVEEPPGAQTKKLIVERLRHEALPCPARGLELVVYQQRTVGSASAETDFELNLNSGREMALRVDEIPGSAAGSRRGHTSPPRRRRPAARRAGFEAAPPARRGTRSRAETRL